MKCIDDEIPFEIPVGWEWCRLGGISTYAQTKRKVNAVNANPQLWGLDLEDIEKGGRLLRVMTVGERKAIGDKTVFSQGDILYSKLRPYLLKILIAHKEGICTPEIIPFGCYGNICADYIVIYLKSPHVDDYINSVTFGVKMPRVGTETMTSLLVPLPPISEQFRIVSKANELMPHIDEYGKAQIKLNLLNEKLPYSLRKSILQEAVRGKLVPQIASEGSAHDLLKQIKQEKIQLVKEGKLKKTALQDSVIFIGEDNRYYEQVGSQVYVIEEDIPFDIPDSWCWMRLGCLVYSETGLAYSKDNLNDKSESMIRVLRGGNIEEGRWSVKDDDVMIASKYVREELLLKRGTFITPAVTSLERMAKTALIETDLHDTVAGGFVLMLKPFLKCDAILEYLNLLFQTPYYKQYCVSITNKSGQAFYNLSRQKLMQCLIPIAPIKEMIRIVTKYESLDL